MSRRIAISWAVAQRGAARRAGWASSGTGARGDHHGLAPGELCGCAGGAGLRPCGQAGPGSDHLDGGVVVHGRHVDLGQPERPIRPGGMRPELVGVRRSQPRERVLAGRDVLVERVVIVEPVAQEGTPSPRSAPG